MAARSNDLVMALAAAIAMGSVLAVGACSGSPETANAATGSGGLLTGASSASSDAASSSGTSVSTAESSTSTSGGGGAGGSGGMSANGGGGAGGSGGAVCDNSDPGEPNDDEGDAYKLGTIDCSDGDGGNIYGVLSDGNDVDWFIYTGNEKFDCVVDASAAIALGQGGVRVCQYFACVSAVTDVGCPPGTTADKSPDGKDGCCATSDFIVTDLNCEGTLTEDIDVLVRIDDPSHQAACFEYTVAYHY